MQKIIHPTFQKIATTLLKLSQKFNISYTEINILLYYLIIPLSWCMMIDYTLSVFYFTPTFISIWIGIFIAVHEIFSEWCNWRFRDSVKFLNSFQKIGWDYEKSSVIICVIVPIIIYGILLLFQFLNN